MELEGYLAVCKQAWEIKQKKQPQYGDSWKTIPLRDLEKRLVEKVQDFLQTGFPLQKRAKSLDIINISVMLNQRYEEMGTIIKTKGEWITDTDILGAHEHLNTWNTENKREILRGRAPKGSYYALGPPKKGYAFQYGIYFVDPSIPPIGMDEDE